MHLRTHKQMKERTDEHIFASYSVAPFLLQDSSYTNQIKLDIRIKNPHLKNENSENYQDIHVHISRRHFKCHEI